MTTNADGTPLSIESGTTDVALSSAVGTTSSGERFIVETTSAPPTPTQMGTADASQTPDVDSDGLVEGVDYTTDGPVYIEEQPIVPAVTTQEASLFAPVMTTAATESTFAAVWAEVAGAVEYTATDASTGTPILIAANSLELTGLEAGSVREIHIDAIAADGQIVLSRIMRAATTSPATANGGVSVMTYQAYTTAFTMEAFLPQNRIDMNFFGSSQLRV